MQLPVPHADTVLQRIQDLLPGWKDRIEQRIDDLRLEFVKAYPDRVDVVANLMAKRKSALALLKDARNEGSGNRRKSWAQLEAKAKTLSVPGLFAKMTEARRWGKLSFEKAMHDRKVASSGAPVISQTSNGFDHPGAASRSQ